MMSQKNNELGVNTESKVLRASNDSDLKPKREGNNENGIELLVNDITTFLGTNENDQSIK